MLNYLVIIPARSGSKRFPGKNLAFLGGIPLIVHSIRYALRFFPAEHVWVNTDADDIASVAKLHGANVFKRNETLATDLTSTSEVLKNNLEIFIKQNKLYDAVILLQPTNPLRPVNLLEDAIQKYESSGRSSLTSFSPLNKKYGKIINGVYMPSNYVPGQRMQDIESDYYENGLIYITSKDQILNNCIIGDDTYPLLVDSLEALVDIDFPEDLIFAEFLINQLLMRPIPD